MGSGRSGNQSTNQMLSEIIGYRYGYKPSDGDLMTAFTYMFLHGSASHLIGNMIFLWLVGCILELAGRRLVYALICLLTGMVSALVYGLVYQGSTIPLVGASGAISGIIGAYTVLFGMRKVKIFFSLGFYFQHCASIGHFSAALMDRQRTVSVVFSEGSATSPMSVMLEV